MNGDQRRRADVGVAVRTLVAAGYRVSESATHPRHVEVACSRLTALGAEVRMLVAFTAEDGLGAEEMAGLRREAERGSRSLLVVAEGVSDEYVSWEDFFRALGGAVPSWRALSPDYRDALLRTSCNQLPDGFGEGEPWFLFEVLASDGLEFVLGRRARHLGGVKRGARVGDVLAQLPDGRVLVVDAKATAAAFDARSAELRALGEYVARQVVRQHGQEAVHAAVVLSSRFQQEQDALSETALDFRAQHGVPVAFVTAETLAHMVDQLSQAPLQRNSLRWAQLFRGGLLTAHAFDAELADARAERLPAGP